MEDNQKIKPRTLRPRKIRLGEDGQAMVEFALTFPLMLTLVTMVVQFAMVFNGTALARYAAYNAARAAAVYLPLNGNNGGNSTVQDKARMAAAVSLAPIAPAGFGGLFGVSFPGLGGIPGLDFAGRVAYTYGILQMANGIKIQKAADFLSNSNSSNWQVREPVYVSLNYYFALMIPPAHQFMWEFAGSRRDGTSMAINALSGGQLKAVRMSAKAAFIYTGFDNVR